MKPLSILSKCLLGGGLLTILTIWYYSWTSSVYTPAPDSLSGQTIVITGGTTGLGLESAKRLAIGGASIHITARTKEKGKNAVKEILAYDETINPSKIHYQILDLDEFANVRNAAHWKLDKIDVLLNNAGVMAIPQRELTKDGYERQIQSNHLGHFLLTAVLAPKFSNDARIINVSSQGHMFARKGIDYNYLWKGEPNYSGFYSYGQSKLCNILFAKELQKRAKLAGKKWTAAAVHPGAVNTDLARDLFGQERWDKIRRGQAHFGWKVLTRMLQMLMKSVEGGANTQVWLAAGNYTNPLDGGYYMDCKESQPTKAARNETDAQRLWEESERSVGTTFDLSKTWKFFSWR